MNWMEENMNELVTWKKLRIYETQELPLVGGILNDGNNCKTRSGFSGMNKYLVNCVEWVVLQRDI
jgi:hypothetical protein